MFAVELEADGSVVAIYPRTTAVAGESLYVCEVIARPSATFLIINGEVIPARYDPVTGTWTP